jgi:hypothetical protein
MHGLCQPSHRLPCFVLQYGKYEKKDEYKSEDKYGKYDDKVSYNATV